jgi:hypothetical protein
MTRAKTTSKRKTGNRAPLAKSVSKRGKQTRGATPSRTTPLTVHGEPRTSALATLARKAFGKKLGKFAGQITRVDVHLRKPSGPKGAPSYSCRAVVSVATREPVSVEHSERNARDAINATADRVERAIRRGLGRSSTKVAPTRGRKADKKRAPSTDKKRTDGKVDTSLPGVSATDKKVGARDTATRNLSARAAKKGGAQLEGSATGTPSRKSTRASKGRAKRTSNLKLAELRQLRAPTTRATKARAQKR